MKSLEKKIISCTKVVDSQRSFEKAVLATV